MWGETFAGYDVELMKVDKNQTFEAFFENPIYLLYKNHLYNFLCRRRAIRQRFDGNQSKQILELGCGTSPMLEAAQGAIRTDFSWRALAFLKSHSRRGDKTRMAALDATRLPFTDHSLDCVISSEMLEHIERDDEVLKEIHRVLKPVGQLLLTCPVRPELFGFDDQFVGHYRRYDVDTLLHQLSEKGFGNFQVFSVLGPLEKQMMEKAIRVFSYFKKGEESSSGFRIRPLAWIFFPFYKVANSLLACLVQFEARLIPLQKAVTVLIRCEKLAA